METKLERLAREALSLSAAGRTAFVELLLASLGSEGDVGQAWIDEAERRDAELERGKVKAIPLDAALAHARDKLK